MYSAIKIGGKKLYEMARRGLEVQRPARDVYIKEIELQSGGGNEFRLRVVCSKGTYIRTLCHDIGAALGCGGTMASLRRIRAGAFTIESALTLDEIIASASSGEPEKLLTPVDSLFSHYPSVTLNEDETRKAKNGSPRRMESLADGKYRFYGLRNEFIFLGNVSAHEVRIIKGFYDPDPTIIKQESVQGELSRL